MSDWKYYNHALVPNCAPHEEPNIDELKLAFRQNKKSKPLFARWTTDWDCNYETNWWYIVRKAPFDIETLSKSKRKHIRQSLKKCNIIKINYNEYLDELYEVYNLAYERYDCADNKVNKEKFISNIDLNLDYWGAFDCLTGKMIGWMTIKLNNNFIEIVSAKYIPEYLNYGCSAALYYTVLNFYLNEKGYLYCNSGERNINHITNVQQYKIDNFGFEKIYCKLHIRYKKNIGLIVKILYPIRKFLKKFDSNGYIHKINAVLKMEEIVRGNK